MQHLLGTGHLRRTLTIAGACARQGLEATVLTGGMPVPWTAPAGVELVQLEPIRVAGAAFGPLLAATGEPVDAPLWAARRERIEATLNALRPQVVMTEMFPFGRRAFHDEAMALLAAARALPTPAVCLASIRDVLVSERRPARVAATCALVREQFASVLVHGDAALLPLDTSFPAAPEIADRLLYTGYVTAPAPPPAARRGQVLVMAGGGAVGHRLLACALEARRSSLLAALPWRLLTGAAMPPELARRLAAVADPGISVERHRDDVLEQLAAARVVVCQAGYNSVVELIASRTPAVLVPFASGGEDEQTTRAQRLAALGMAVHLAEQELSAAELAAAIDRAAAIDARRWPTVDLAGAERSAAIIARAARVASAA